VELLHQTEVTPDQIDHLGHMNVRFYGVHARAGADRLLARLGITPDPHRAVVGRDVYVRHHHEQLVGAPLEVRGGVLDASTSGLRLYEELVNPVSGDLAASFVLAFDLAEPTTRTPLALDESIVAAARAELVSLPDRGRPRSIRLDDDPAATAPSLELLRERGLAMRRPRVIAAGELGMDERGLVSSDAVAELMWGGEPLEGDTFRPLEALPDGGTMGFAIMETRSSWARVPKAGDRVQSFAAQLDVQPRWMLSRHWSFDVDRGDLVVVFTVVNLAFDPAARRAVVMPDAVRARLASRLQPDLATGPAATTA
jgi:acyl-CoA thioester hydrolase